MMMQTLPIMATQTSSSSISAIERAAGVHFWLFVAYIGVLVLAAILTIAVWRSGNRVQDAIRADAEAKIAAAHEGLARSNEEIARLNADSANTAERTAALALKVEQESMKRIEAEKELEQIRKRQEQRWLEWTPFSEALKGKPTCDAVIAYQGDDQEAYIFATSVHAGFRIAGWGLAAPIAIPSGPGSSGRPRIVEYGGGGTSGIALTTNSIEDNAGAGTPLRAVIDAFIAAGVFSNTRRDENVPTGTFRIVIWRR